MRSPHRASGAGAPAQPRRGRARHSVAVISSPIPSARPIRSLSRKRLPRGTAVVYRHFGAADRARIARRLARDLPRARACSADRRRSGAGAPRAAPMACIGRKRACPSARGALRLVTAAAHCADGVARAAAYGADACVLSPVFPTRSASAHAPLGLFRASQIARAARIPVIALGGVNARNGATARRTRLCWDCCCGCVGGRLEAERRTRCARRRAALLRPARRTGATGRRLRFDAQFAADAHARRELVIGADRGLIAAAAFRRRARSAGLRERRR